MVTESFPPHSGGSGWSTYYLSRALQKKGHKILIAKIKGKETEYKEINIAPINNKKDIDKLVKEHKIDLIHCQHRVSTIWGVNHGVPTTSTIRDYWHISYDGTAFNEKTGKNYEKETFKTIYDSLTKYPKKVRLLSLPIILYLYFKTKYSKNKLKKCDALICNSTFTRKTIKDTLPLMKGEIIPNLIDTQKLSQIEKHNFKKKTVLFVGKLTKNKGAQLIIEAAKLINQEVQFVFIGEGPLQETIKNKAKEYNVEVKFPGYLPNDEVLSMMKGCSVLTLPALWYEPLGRTHLEGIGVGAKIVTTNTGGTPDIIEDGVNGLFFDKTPEDLAKKITQVLENEEIAKTIAENAQTTAKEKFDEDVVIPKFEKFYANLLDMEEN